MSLVDCSTNATKPAPVPSHVLRTIALYALIRDAILREQPLVVLYATKGVEMKARVILPYDLYSTDAGADLVRAHDSLTNEIKSFRVDRLLQAHHLTAV